MVSNGQSDIMCHQEISVVLPWSQADDVRKIVIRIGLAIFARLVIQLARSCRISVRALQQYVVAM